MAKLGKDEFNKKYSEKINDDNLLIELMEDATDSFDNRNEVETLKAELEESNRKYTELQNKYKERFLSGEVVPPKKEEEYVKEKEYVDIREI